MICEVFLAYGRIYFACIFLANTSNFLAHIKAIHPNALDDEKEKQGQPKMSFIAKPNQRKADRSTVNDNLSKMIVGKVLPCSLVEMNISSPL